MATALYPLRKAQIGLESVPGTLVAATEQLVGEITYTEEIDREFEEFPRGVRAPVTGGGYDIRGGSLLNFSGNFTWEEAIYPLLLGVHDVASPGGAGPFEWDGDPVLNGPADIATATVEFVIGDGSAEHVERRSGHMFCTGFTLTLAANQIAQWQFALAGRRSQVATFTPALTPITGRRPVPSNLFQLFRDSNWGTIGTTPLSQFLRAATLTVDTGLTPDYTLDGRGDLDLTGINSGMLNATLDLTAEVNAAAAAELAAFRSSGGPGRGDVGFYRLGANNGAAGADERAVSFDMALKHLQPPAFSQDTGIEIVTLNLGLEYDATGGKAFVMTLLNGLSAAFKSGGS